MEKAELICVKSRSEKRSVRIKSDILRKLNKSIGYAATAMTKEMRFIDGYLPVILIMLASISGKVFKLSFVELNFN